VSEVWGVNDWQGSSGVKGLRVYTGDVLNKRRDFFCSEEIYRKEFLCNSKLMIEEMQRREFIPTEFLNVGFGPEFGFDLVRLKISSNEFEAGIEKILISIDGDDLKVERVNDGTLYGSSFNKVQPDFFTRVGTRGQVR